MSGCAFLCDHNVMKPVFTARHVTEAHLIRGYLQSHGIAAEVRGEFLAGGIGDLPAGLCKVYLVDEADLARADALVKQFLRGETAVHAVASWRCAHCGEQLEGQFTDCWHCGTARPG